MYSVHDVYYVVMLIIIELLYTYFTCHGWVFPNWEVGVVITTTCTCDCLLLEIGFRHDLFVFRATMFVFIKSIM